MATLSAKRPQLLPGLAEHFDSLLPGAAAQIIPRQKSLWEKRVKLNRSMPGCPLVCRPSMKRLGGSVVAEQLIRTLIQQF